VLAFVILLAPLVVVGMGALLCLILGLFYVLYLRPLLDWLTRPAGGFFRRVVFWPLKKVGQAIGRFARAHIAALLNAYLARSGPLVRLLENLTELTQRLAGTLGDNAEATYKALVTLRKVTIPTLVEAAVKPVRVLAQQADARLDVVEGKLVAVEGNIRAMLATLPWGAPSGLAGAFTGWLNSYRQLWEQFFDVAKPQLAKLTTVDVPLLWAEALAISSYVYGKLEPRVKELELGFASVKSFLAGVPASTQAQLDKLINPAFFALAVGAALAKFAPNLFCKNVTATTQRICGQDEAMWAQLLAGTLLFALVLDPRALAKVAEGVTGTLEGVIRETAIR